MKMRRRRLGVARWMAYAIVGGVAGGAGGLSGGLVQQAGAVDFEWDGGAGNNLWDATAGPDTNWSPESRPAAPDNIILTNLSNPGSITIDLDGSRFINSITVNGVDGTYTFDNTGSGSLTIFAAGNGLLNTHADSTLVVDADVLLNASGRVLFNTSPSSGRIIVNGDVSTSAAAGTTTLELTSRNLTLDQVVQVHGVVSDGPTATMALNAGFAGDAANHRGVVQVTGANTFTGSTRVNGAILEFNSIADVGGGPNALGQPVLADSTINVGTGSTVGALRYTGTAVAGHTSDRVINMAGNTGGTTIDASGAGPLVLSGGVTSTLSGSKVLTLTGNNTDENAISGVIEETFGGSVHLTKSGAGTWVLTAANQAAGPVNVNEGELILRGAGSVISSLGSLSQVHINNDATFTLEGGTVNAIDMDRGANATFNFKSGTVNLTAGTSTFNAASGPLNIGTDGAGTLNLNGTTAQFNDGVVIQGAGDELNLTAGQIQTTSLDNTNGGTFNFTGGSVVINGGQITTGAGAFNGSVSGSGGLTKVGAGTLTLNNTALYDGPTNINEGTLALVGNINHLGGGTTIDIAAGATLDVSASDGDGVGGLTGEGTVITATGADIQPGFGDQSTIFDGVVTGTGNLLKAGTGTLTLNGTHTYSGGVTTVNGGTIKLGAGNILPDDTRVALAASGATLDLDNNDEEIGGLSGVAGSVVQLGTATLTVGSNNETLNFDGAINGDGGLTKVGNGTLRLQAHNPFTGDINVNDGTLEIGQNDTIVNNAVIVASGATLRVAGNAESFGSLAGAGTVVSAVNTSVGVNPGFNNTDTTFSGDITGIGPFVKSGTGTMTMTGLSDYTGRTRVDNGELVFDGASAGLTQTNGIVLNGGDVTVRNGASLNSTGSTGFIHLDTPASTMTIESGGSVTSASHTSLGETAGSFGQLRVTGVGSQLETLGTSRVRPGNNGVGQLIVDNGGTVITNLLAISDTGTGSAGSTALVEGFLNNGANGTFGDDDDVVSAINVGSRVFVGDQARGSLTIQNGGRVVSGTGSNNHLSNQSHIGAFAVADGSIATITGENSRWVHNGHLEIARFGGDATNPVELRVLEGGYAEFSHIFTTPNDGSRSKITVDGTDSMLKVRDARGDAGVVSPGFGDIRMVPANSNGFSEIFVTGGGLLDIDTRLAIGQGGADTGGQAHVTVDGADSTINAGNEVIVGLTGTTASLTITDGGTVNAGTDDTVVSPVRDSFIAHTSSNATATVGAEAGMDSGHSEALWNIDGNLYIAGNQVADNNGHNGVLNINPTGRVSVAGQVRVWDTGVINLNGGVLELDSIDMSHIGDVPGVPTLNWNSGTLRYTTNPGVTLDATLLDQLLGTSPTLSNGQNLVIDNDATVSSGLRLNGGGLSVGSIDTASLALVDFDAGTFTVTDDDFTVFRDELFDIKSGLSVNVPNDLVKVQLNAALNVLGSVSAKGGISNGQINAINATLTFGPMGLESNGELNLINTVVNGPINLSSGSSVEVAGHATFTGDVTGPASFEGSGEVNFNAGFGSGSETAVITFDGDVTFGPNSTLFIQIGGTTPGPGPGGHDQIAAPFGTATLDGTLEIALIDGFLPDYGDVFTVVTANTLAGEHDTVEGNIFLSDNRALVPILDLDDDVLTLVTTAPGDANVDGQVSFADFAMLQNNFDQPGDWFDGDFNGDGMVTFADFALMQNNFNQVFFTDSPALTSSEAELTALTRFASAAVTPEPGSMVLLILPGAAWLAACRRR